MFNQFDTKCIVLHSDKQLNLLKAIFTSDLILIQLKLHIIRDKRLINIDKLISCFNSREQFNSIT